MLGGLVGDWGSGSGLASRGTGHRPPLPLPHERALCCQVEINVFDRRFHLSSIPIRIRLIHIIKACTYNDFIGKERS